MITEQWLSDSNEEFRRAGIEPGARPWRAIEKYGNETNLPVAFSSPEVNLIFSWFEKNLAPGSLNMRPLFTGVFFYDAAIWVFSIPVVYGRAAVEPLKLFATMPSPILLALANDAVQLKSYISHWSECFDFASGLSSILDNAGLDEFGRTLFRSGIAELEAAIAQMTQQRPNSKAMMSSRMATEMFLKSLLAIKRGLPDREARDISHRLDMAIDRCIEATGSEDLTAIKPKLGIFPEIRERYDGEEKPLSEIWEAYRLAQQVASTVKRLITGEDERPEFGLN